MTFKSHSAVFLDRDGVLNRALVRDGKPYPPRTLDQLEILPGVVEACAEIARYGALLICVTNQPDVARGRAERSEIEAINKHLQHSLKLDSVRTCWHDSPDNCACRKPKPGLLIDAAQEFNIDLHRSVMVGDRWSDVEAGRSVGAHTVFVDYEYIERRPESPDLIVSSLPNALPKILFWLS
jgi:D-glycero-D-manno-heptose 1,7-bisphosphate phosphatase